MPRLRLEPTVFYLMLVAALLPVWTCGRFFMTGDGPCHVYNARVLLDYVIGRNVDFYSPFYFLNEHFDPNWFSHIVLAALQLVFSPELAEKIFLSGYVSLFAFGLRFLVRQINPENWFIACLGLLFCWHNLLQSGFYNYGCSIAMFFWVAGFWLKHRGQMNWRRALILAGLLVAQYSMHPVGLVFSGMFIALDVVAASWSGAGWRAWIKRLGWALASALPAIVFFVLYLLRKEWPRGANGDSLANAWQGLRDMTALQTVLLRESAVTDVLGTFIPALFLVAVWQRVRRWAWGANDFLLFWLGFALAYYFQQAGKQSLELLMPQRLQIFPWLGLVLWAATAHFPAGLRHLGWGAGMVFMAAFLAIRLPVHREASALEEDYMGCIPYVQDRSIVLVLNYDYGGRKLAKLDSSQAIADRNYLFNHAADYLGAYKTCIMSDNYEALRWYFPFIWHWERDMFVQTDKDGINFLHEPPRADLLSFERRTGGYKLGYVLQLGGPTPEIQEHPYSKEIEAQLAQAYERVFQSPRGRAVLWKLKQ